MTNNLPAAGADPTTIIEPATASRDSSRPSVAGSARFAMIALYVEDLQSSVDFYRLVGLHLADPRPDSPVVIYKEGEERRMIIGTDAVAKRFDPNWAIPRGTGYRQTIEFFVDDDAAVDAAWQRLTAAGFPGISAPATPNGAYTTLVNDPDGNVVMVTHEP